MSNTPSGFEFEDVRKDAERIEGDVRSFSGYYVNEFGELEDESDNDNITLDDNDQETTPDTETNQPVFTGVIDVKNKTLRDRHHTQSRVISQPTDLKKQPRPSKHSWLKQSNFAPSESDKEFQLFTSFCMCGGGRSLQYISRISGTPYSRIQKIAQVNNWSQRAADFDRYQFNKRLAEAQDARHERHLRRLEEYRYEQEQLGQQLTLNAARIASLANRKLESIIESESDLDTKELPAMLNAASKLAEVGRNLQSSALGVDQLLSAIEEVDI